MGTPLRDTYVMYPYHKSHENRALGSPKCRTIRYLITMRIRIRILRTKVHVELGREYLPHGNLMSLILRTNLLFKPNGNPVAIIALSILNKATATTIASNFDDVSMMSVSNAGDVMMASPNQNKDLLNNNSFLPKKQPVGKGIAIIAVMRGKLKDGHHCHHSNKHYKQKLVWVLLDSGSDEDLVFVNKYKPMLLSSSKMLVPKLWNTSNEMFQTKHNAGIELNFFKYSNSKRYLAEPDIIKYNKNNKPQYDLTLGLIKLNCQCKTSTICRALALSVR